MENFNDDYLQHHGTKGMKWGVRRYQNKDGSLTPAGRKHYAKESEKLKAEEQKLKAEKKVLANQKKTQAKFDKLDEKKAKLEAEKKALKDEQKKLKKGEKESNEKPAETVEEKRARLLKSTDANELYKNRDLLTEAEIKERLGRIDTEQKLAAVAASTKTTGMQKVDKAIKTFEKIDEVYTTLSKSGIGGLVKKKLGIGDEKSGGFDLDKAYKNLYSMSDEQAKKAASRVENNEKIRKAWEQAHGKKPKDANEIAKEKQQQEDEKKMAEYKKQVDDYNERWARGEFETTYAKSGKNLTDAKYDTKADRVERVTAEVVSDAEYEAIRNGRRYVAGILDTALNSEAARAGRLLLEEAIK